MSWHCPTDITFQEAEPHGLMRDPSFPFLTMPDTRPRKITKTVLRALSFATCIGLISISIVQTKNDWPLDGAVACPPVPITLYPRFIFVVDTKKIDS